MYARIITAQLNPGKIDQVTALWRDTIAAQIKQYKGFTGGYVTDDRR